jgi:hypothetical protein
MATARSFGNYDLLSALADLIDNSIKAQSRNIELSYLYNRGNPLVRVLDDGYGMTAEELQLAMRPASSNPDADRGQWPPNWRGCARVRSLCKGTFGFERPETGSMSTA